MFKKIIPLIFILLSGCAHKLYEYTASPSLSPQESASIIEQVLMEQTKRYRPESVLVTDQYVTYGKGMVSSGGMGAIGLPAGNSVIMVGSQSRRSKYLHERIYFDSILSIEIYTKRQWYVIQIKTDASTTNFYTSNEKKAKRFADAFSSMMKIRSEGFNIPP